MRAGADGRPEPTVARQSSPELAVLAEFALRLPSFFLTSIAGAFGFGAGDAGRLGISLLAAVAPAPMEVALPLPSSVLISFLTSLAAIFGFGAGDAGCLGGCLPAAVAPAPMEVALPLSSFVLTSCLTSLAAIFGFGAGDAGRLGISLPAAIAPVSAEVALPLPSVLSISTSAIFGFGRQRHALASRDQVELARNEHR